MAYPNSPAETLADGVVHFAGLALAIPASVMLLWHLPPDDGLQAATLLYVVTLLFALTVSALYHLLPFDRLRPTLARIDHASIYFKIAGTYTPIVALLGSGLAYGVLGVVWALACAGALAKLWFWRIDGRGSLLLYLAMGWLSLLLIGQMWQHLPGPTLCMIVLGGLVYSIGTVVYAHPGMRYQNAIWHVFVLVASICLFAAIALAVRTPLPV